MKKGIICAGNWVVDKVKLIDRWPNEGELCNISSQIRSTGGAANVCFDLAVMDPALPLYAAGKIGNDDDGDLVIEHIKSHKVDDAFMIRSSDASTSYTDVMSGGGKRTFFHCRGTNADYGFEDLADIDVPARYFYMAYLLLLDKMDSADPEYGTVAAKTLCHMQKKGYKTVVDFVSDAPEKFRKIVMPALPYIDLLIVNEIESSACCGLELRRADGSMNWKNLPKALDFFFENGVKDAAVIHFPEGAAGRTCDGEFIYCPSCHIEKKDIAGSTGAGDAFAAGVIYAMHENWDLASAMKLGGASSNFNLRSVTANEGAVSLADLQEYLKDCQFSEVPTAFAGRK